MNIEQFVKENDVIAHIQAAIDELAHGGLGAIDGLQEGKVAVDLVFEGGAVHFRKHEVAPGQVAEPKQRRPHA